MGKILAYHDLSDGGLWTTICEMAFAGNCGLNLNLDATLPEDIRRVLFGEELGAVIQVAQEDAECVQKLTEQHRLRMVRLGSFSDKDWISVRRSDGVCLEEKMTILRGIWGEVSWRMSRRRDHPACADAEHRHLSLL